jgi:hypothetical protein
MSDITELIGRTLAGIENTGDEIKFFDIEGRTYRMYHSQDCCESVTVEDVAGDLGDLIGSPILEAEESGSDARPADVPMPNWTPDSETWTFYKLATIKGRVTIRWYGSSNGYYSESVNFEEVKGE